MRPAVFYCRLIRVQPSSQLSRSVWVATFALLPFFPSVPRLEFSPLRTRGRVKVSNKTTRRPRDASSKGRIIQGTHRPKDASSKGCMHHPMDSLTKERNIRDFSFGDTSVGDEITLEHICRTEPGLRLRELPQAGGRYQGHSDTQRSPPSK